MDYQELLSITGGAPVQTKEKPVQQTPKDTTGTGSMSYQDLIRFTTPGTAQPKPSPSPDINVTPTPAKAPISVEQQPQRADISEGRKRGPVARFFENLMPDAPVENLKRHGVMDRYFLNNPSEKIVYDKEIEEAMKDSNMVNALKNMGKIEQKYIDKGNLFLGKPKEVSVGESLETPFQGAIAAGVIANPVATTIRLGGFTWLDKVINARGRLPKDTPLWAKDAVEGLAFIGEGGIVEGGYQGLKSIVNPEAPKGTIVPGTTTIPKGYPTVKGIVDMPGAVVKIPAEQGKSINVIEPEVAVSKIAEGTQKALTKAQDQRKKQLQKTLPDPAYLTRPQLYATAKLMWGTENFDRYYKRLNDAEQKRLIQEMQPKPKLQPASVNVPRGTSQLQPASQQPPAPPMKVENLPRSDKPITMQDIATDALKSYSAAKRPWEGVASNNPPLEDRPVTIYEGNKIRFWNERGMEDTGIVQKEVSNLPESKIAVVDSKGKPAIVTPDKIIAYHDETEMPIDYVKALADRYKSKSVIGGMINRGEINGSEFVRSIQKAIRFTRIGIKKQGAPGTPQEDLIMPIESEKGAYELAQLNRMGQEEYIRDITQQVSEQIMDRKISKDLDPDKIDVERWLRDMIKGEVKNAMIDSSTSPDAPERYKSRWWKQQFKKISADDIKAVAFELRNKTGQIPTPKEIAKKLIPYQFPISDAKAAEDLLQIMSIKKTGAFQSLSPEHSAIAGSSVNIGGEELSGTRIKQQAISRGKRQGRSTAGSIGESGQLNHQIITGAVQGLSERATRPTKAFFHDVQKLVNPVSLVPRDAMDIMMIAKGKYEKELFMADRATHEIEKMWDKQPEDASLQFIADIEAGRRPAGTTTAGALADIADFYRGRLDNLHIALSKYRQLNFIDNFFPHFWKDPARVESQFVPGISGRRPLSGTGSFLRQRVFQTIQDGINAGFEPVSKNPETLMKLYEQNARKFLMAQEIKAEYKEKGFWKFVKHGEEHPADFARINDRIAKVYFPPDIAEVRLGGSPTRRMVEAGEYWVQKDLARIINNYLDRDLLMDTTVGRGLLNAKNALNAWQLGFSGFHFTFETIDAATTRLSIGMNWLLAGHPLKALKSASTAFAAPIAYFKSGAKFYDNPEIQRFTDDLFTGGASLREKQYYKNTILDQMLRDFRSKKYTNLFSIKNIAAIPELMMRPLFAFYIPRLKVGSFAELLSQQLELNAAKIASGERTHAEIARSVWGNIENRMGELNYDNLFWHRTFKTAAMLEFRAVGWQVGKMREMGGAFFNDLPKQVGNLFHGKPFEFTPKMSYTLSLALMTCSIGGVLHKLLTGKNPEHLIDYVYPKNGKKDEFGNDERIQLPTQLKDIYKETTDLPQSIRNKFAPEFNSIIEFISNRDFYGDYITNENDNLPERGKQFAKWFIESWSPISLRNTMQEMKGETGLMPRDIAMSLMGIVKAPREITQTPYEKDLYQATEKQEGGTRGPRTPERKAEDELKAKARRELRHGNLDTFNKLVEMGVFPTEKSETEFLQTSPMPAEYRLFMHLHPQNKVDFIKQETEKIKEKKAFRKRNPAMAGLSSFLFGKD